MTVVNFPPVEMADEHGLLAVGGDLEVASLLLAYRRGIFPWPISEEYPLAWFSPDPRGVLDYQNLKVSSRLKRYFASAHFEIRFNTAFCEVIEACAKVPRKGQSSTWITKEIIESYQKLFDGGHAYSAETWHGGKLVGGVYGVCMDGIVTGESMFYLEDHASKFALVMLMEKLHAAGIDWIDTQMVTPVVNSLGGTEISRDDFLGRLACRKHLETKDIF